LSEDVERVSYRHGDEPGRGDVVRVHDFDPGQVELWVQSDGTLLLRRKDGRTLWKRFPR